MRHVDGAHEPEDQGEPGRDDEEQTTEGQAVEQGDDKVAGLGDERALWRRRCP
jgi:hypothetical protein